MNFKRAIQAIGAGLIIMITATACTSTPPSIQTGPDAEVTFDGLHKVDNSQADEAWAKPGLDLSKYTKIMTASAGIEYRPVKDRGNSSYVRRQGGPYFIDEESRDDFEGLVKTVFDEELDKIERFEIVTEPGPDTLLVAGGLLDVVSYVPPDLVGGRSEVFLSSIGEATLVLELRDSETGAILARSVDRRAAETMGGSMTRSNSVTNKSEVRRLIRFWATRLRESLDGFTAE